MIETWRKYYSDGAPRYTSYPSALHFDNAVTAQDLTEKLRETELYEPLSLYVHIPFCRELCWYCGCNMRVENDYRRAYKDVQALASEIALYGNILAGRGRPLNVHFGGGTPNYLCSDDLADILCAIEQEIGLTDNANLSIEIDPRLVRDDEIERLAAIGFNRFSLGVQDFDPEVQRAVNRRQSFELISDCVSAIRAAGVDDLSFDLLYGLPQQTEQTFAATLAKTISLSPDRVSVFGYAHMPQMLPRQKMIDSSTLPDVSLRCALATLADERLLGAGYQRIGFDHYAKPDSALAKANSEGRLKRNFQGFTDDAASTLIGFGASAISFIDGVYSQNEKSIADFIARLTTGELPVARGLKQSKRESQAALVISELLCTLQANVSELLKGSPPPDAIRMCAALERLEADGVIHWVGDIITVAEGAHALARSVAMALDPYAPRQSSSFAAI